MTICPIPLAVGCEKCPAFKFCPLTTVLGDQEKEEGPTTKVWEESFPKDLKLQVGANVKEASLESEPPLMEVAVQPKISKKRQSTLSKKDRSHLRVIK